MHPASLSTVAVLTGGLLLLPFAPTSAPLVPAAPVATSAGPVTWTVDPVHSSVLLRIKHLGAAWMHGRFDAMSGTIVLDREQPGAASIQFTVDAASINTGNKDRDDHLRGPDFFNAKAQPKISFQSTKVAADGKDKFQVTGKLKLNGVEKEITVPAELVGTGTNMQKQEVAGFEATFTIKRSDYGISAYPGALGEEVKLTVSIEAVKQG
jgi:polyisoprenoid-binding protein YceI